MPLRMNVHTRSDTALIAALLFRHDGHQVRINEIRRDHVLTDKSIHIPPNASRILKHLGLLEKVERVAEKHDKIWFRNYATSSVLGNVTFSNDDHEFYGAPYLVIDHIQLHLILKQALDDAGVTYFQPFFSPQRDLEVAADSGVDLSVRTLHDGLSSDAPSYRQRQSWDSAAISTDEAGHLLDYSLQYWLGPQCVVSACASPDRANYNFTIRQPPVEPGLEMTAMQHRKEAERRLSVFESVIRLATRFSDPLTTADEQLYNMTRRDIENLIGLGHLRLTARESLAYIGGMNREGNFGEEQATAMAFEDAAVLTHCFRQIQTPSSVPEALESFKNLRAPRLKQVLAGMKKTQELMQLPDGPEQRARDAALAFEHEIVGFGYGNLVHSENTHDLAEDHAHAFDAGFRRWLFGFDALAGPTRVMR